ncbi:MAG TPA: bifunctional [glutamine synthetase] adenylyltransferase/[glutamine synthetase]-adenylyl-L-tyrosine phosphorylase [Candidatus Cybelea sp.]|nr:bifunctional [glutamine synthetase] adenylyltransferase/[glutamine synthetase]-adenylyl-L-tyrosine phosphorylase [Candidatus Cybelea sp.]
MHQLVMPWRGHRLPRPADPAAAAEGLRRWDEAAAALEDASLCDFARGFAANRDGMALLKALFGNSPFLTQCALDEMALIRAFSETPADEILAAVLAEAADLWRHDEEASLSHGLRLAKRRIALLTALADVAGRWELDRVTGALTRFAEIALQAATAHLLRRAAGDGQLRLENDNDPSRNSGFAVIGMGKLGARELNYSSDIDVIALYDEEKIDYRGDRTPQDCFVRITRGLVRILQERTNDGYVFRTDLRLRPDPGATPLAMGMAAAESYYEALGQNWERAAMIKARAVAGDLDAGAGFLQRLAPFVWRKHLDFAAIEDIHSIKRQIHAYRGHEVVTVPGHDIKVGRGGIREIEFFVQTQQLIAGGRDRRLRVSDTLGALRAFRENGRLDAETETQLASAYRFLRRLEHRLQMVADEQTHRLPESPEDLASIAAFFGSRDAAEFQVEVLHVLRTVQGHYDALFATAAPLGASGSLVFTGTEDDPATLATLKSLGFRETKQVAAIVRGWHHGRYRAMRSVRARELLTELMPRLLEALGTTANPDDAFIRFDGFLGRLPAGVQLFSLFYANPGLLDVVARIMGTAPSLADLLSRYPSLLDSLLSDAFDAPGTDAGALAAELEGELSDAADLQDLLDAARRFAGQRRFRIGAQMLAGAALPETAAERLSDVADAVLDVMLRRVTADFAQAHGQVRDGAMVVVGLGKLGAREMTFTSDLDLIFVYDHAADAAESDGPRPLPASQYFARLSQRIINALTAATGEGILYEVDMRLRPSGNKGPVAVRFDGFARYQKEEAWTWEHMALTRARVIAGPAELARRVDKLLRSAISVRRDEPKLRADILEMHRLVREQHGTADPWNIKHATGGLLDLEFIAQYLLLRHANAHPAVLTGSTVDAFRRLGAAKLLPEDVADDLSNAARFLSALQSVIRLCMGGSFDPANTPEGLKRLLASVGGTANFSALKNKLRSVEGSVAAALAATFQLGASTRKKPATTRKKERPMPTELKVGDKAPGFTLATDGGGSVSLKELKGGTVVLYFYPKDDTSGCTREAIDFTAHARAFAKAGAAVIGCSKDSAASHDKFKKKHKLGITLASDPEGTACEAYGVWIEKSMYGRKYMGIDRSTFVIDASGKLRNIWRKVKVPGHAEEVLAAVKAL